MQKKEEGGRSLCLGMRRWCMLGTWLARKTRTVLLPPLFVLPCLSENYQSPGAGSSHAAAHHRPDRILTGTSQFPPAFVGFIGTPEIADRHQILPVGRNFLQKTIWQQTGNRQCMAWGFQVHVSMVMLPIMFWTQRSMTFDPRAINGAWWRKESNLPFDVRMHATNKMGSEALSSWSPRPRWPGIEAHYITWSMNVPWFPHLVWHPKPSECNAWYANMAQHATWYQDAKHNKHYATNMTNV